MQSDGAMGWRGTIDNGGLWLVGFTSLMSQIVLMRYLWELCYGNELIAGIFFSAWLFWSGAGALVGQWIAKRFRKFPLIFFHLLYAGAIPTAFAISHLLRIIFGEPGQLISPIQVILLCFSSQMLLCFMGGYLFSIYCAVLADRQSGKVGSLGSAFAWDNFGALMGGSLFSFIMVHFWDTWTSIGFLLCLQLVYIGIRIFHADISPSVKNAALFITLIAMGGIMAAISPARQTSFATLWPQQRVVTHKVSRFGHIVVTEENNQRNFFENGIHLFSCPDVLTAEKNVHLPMLQVPEPKRVLFLGNAFGGELREVEKYSLSEVVLFSLDPTLISVAQNPLFNPCSGMESANIQVVAGDGRRLLQHSKARFDVIIMNVPDPENGQINRYYTREFFSLVKKHLTRTGVFFFSVTGAENYISNEQAEFLLILKKTLGAVFSQLVLVPGTKVGFLASSGQSLTLDSETLLARLRERGIHTTYMESTFIPFELLPFKRQILNSALHGVDKPSMALNEDFYPISYFLQSILWSKRFSTLEQKSVQLLSHISPLTLLGVALLFWLLVKMLQKGKPERSGWRFSLPLVVTGMTEIALEIMVILLFQIFNGMVYYQVGLLITCNMLGLTLGAILSHVLMRPPVRSFNRYVMVIQGCLMLISMSVPAVVYLTTAFPSRDLWIAWVCYLILLLAGILGGLHFPIAATLMGGGNRSDQQMGGVAYWLDLTGSSVGALLTGVLFIPIYGFITAGMLLMVLNGVALISIVVRE